MTYPIPNFVNTVATGGSSTSSLMTVFMTRDPTAYDINYPVTKKWINTVNNKEWVLFNFTSSSGVVLANWQFLASVAGEILFLSGNSGGEVGPTAGNINIIGDGSTISIVGNPATSTLTASYIGPTGGVSSVSGTANRITSSPTTGNVVVDISASYVGQSSITTLGTIGTGVWNGTTIAVANGGTGNTAAATSGHLLIGDGTIYQSAAPISGTGIVVGLGAGSMTVSLITPVSVANGGTGAITFTSHGVLVGNTASAISATAEGATGTVLSGNTGSAPTFQTLSAIAVTNIAGTTNQIAASAATGSVTLSTPSTFIAPGTIAATTSVSSPSYLLTGSSSGTISILPQTNAGTYNFNLPITAGTSGYILTSGGGGGAPMTWTNPSAIGEVTSVTGTANQILASPTTGNVVLSLIGPYTPATYTTHGVLIGEGTSSITALGAGSSGQVLQSGGASADPAYSTATYPAVATGTGKILIADGTNWVASTPTYPNSASSTGTILRANGTNWVATTATYPTTTTLNQLLYSSSASVIGEVTASNNGVLISGTTGIPSWLAAGTTGQVLVATTSNPASWGTLSSIAVTSVAGTANQIAASASTGAVTLSLVGPYTPATYTAHGVLIGEGTGSIVALGAAATGTVLAGSTGADPSFTATPTVTSITLANGTALNTNIDPTAFTPILSFGGSSTGITYSLQQGIYARIGRIVYIDIQITLSSKGSATGSAMLSGLPYSASASCVAVFPIAWTNLTLVTSGQAVYFQTIAGSADGYVFIGGSGGTLSDTNFQNTSSLILSGVYHGPVL
jgi:hypothetical protein